MFKYAKQTLFNAHFWVICETSTDTNRHLETFKNVKRFPNWDQ